MNKAIKQAIEGGYGDEKTREYFNWLNENKLEHSPLSEFVNQLLLDPLFWQALGKAEGWGKTRNFTGQRKDSLLSLWKEEWQVYWHCFIDHLAKRKPIDDFFNELLIKSNE